MVKNKGAIANELKPFEPTHPGEVLKDEIDCRGISQRQLAHEIGVPSSLLNEVLNGERALNTQLALLLSAALDIDAEPLLRLQAKYDMLTLAIKHHRSSNVLIFIRLKIMKKINYFLVFLFVIIASLKANAFNITVNVDDASRVTVYLGSSKLALSNGDNAFDVKTATVSTFPLTQAMC